MSCKNCKKRKLSEQTDSSSSGPYDSPLAWEQGGILTQDTGLDMVGSETFEDAPEIGISDDLGGVDIITISIEDLGMGDTNLSDIFGDEEEDTSLDDTVEYEEEDTSLDDTVEYEDDNWLVIDKKPEEDEEEEISIDEEEEYLRRLYENPTTPKFKRTLNESVKNIRNMIKRIS